MNLDFLTIKKLIDPIPGIPDSRVYLSLLGFFILLILGSILLHFLKKPALVYFQNTRFYSLSIGITGLVHVFARYEFLPWLGSRWVLLILILGLLILVGYALSMTIIDWPQTQRKLSLEKKYRQYLPKNGK